MNTHLSPKDLASAIGVSESSLKRWVDEGRLVAARTVGGHRRIAMFEAVRFIRESGSLIVRPELLGLPDVTERPVRAVASGGGEAVLLAALQAGQAELSRGIIIAQYLASHSVAAVCDGPIAHAMHRIGELWRHSDDGIAIEHRALTICIEAMHRVRMLLPPVADGSPVAVGGALQSDPYTLPTLMAATCFAELGVRDVNLGADTPVDSLIGEARAQRAKFVWLSVSSLGEGVDLTDRLRVLSQGVTDCGASLLLGGRAVAGIALPPMPNLHAILSMSELAAYVRAALSKSGGAMSNGAGARGNGEIERTRQPKRGQLARE